MYCHEHRKKSQQKEKRVIITVKFYLFNAFFKQARNKIQIKIIISLRAFGHKCWQQQKINLKNNTKLIKNNTAAQATTACCILTKTKDLSNKLKC